MDFERLAQLLYPNITETPDDIEKMFPKRVLPDGAKVTRMAPSPTGFMHLGNLFGAVTDERLAHQSNGVFVLRIEDTDLKREVEGGVETIIKVFDGFGLHFDEGVTLAGDIGAYGPYHQRQRASIYQTIAKQLVREGKAYPCFCTEEELSSMRQKQEELKVNFGYYGKWAVHRDMSIEDVERELKNGKPFVLRVRANGNADVKQKFKDLAKGIIDVPENDQDMVLLKSDGIPTYHFAHVVDDHFMRVTHVVRGEEWLATLPLHLQLFDYLSWDRPFYIHTAQLMKMDGESKRKLSKRKDPELSLDYYHETGYPVESVMEYLMTLLNSNFEEWRIKNPTSDINDFIFTTEKMSVSGSLFDIDKLKDISKNTVAKMDAEAVYGYVEKWAGKYDTEFYKLLSSDPAYAKNILAIGRGGAKPRKDIAVWSEVKDYMGFFYDKYFKLAESMPENIASEDAVTILEKYIKVYDENDDQSIWFDRIRKLTGELGFASEMKEYKKDPAAYRGHVGDVSQVLRLALTGRPNSPDLYMVMKILGTKRINDRIMSTLSIIKRG